MKRFFPILRDNVYGLFDRDLTGKIVLVTMDAVHLSRMLLEVLEVFVKSEHKKGVLLSYDRPADCIDAVLDKFWIPDNDIVFIDGATRIGGLPKELGPAYPKSAKVRVLEAPFDLRCLMGTLKDALLKDFKKSSDPLVNKEGSADAPGESCDRKEFEEELIKAELDIYGIRGAESSLLRYRIMRRVRERLWRMEMGSDRKEGADKHRIAPWADDALSTNEWLASWREGADFLLVENLATLTAYFSDEDLGELIRYLKTVLAEGLCRSVIVFLDRTQYPWVMDRLRETPDLEFDLEVNICMGVTGYRLVPTDHGL